VPVLLRVLFAPRAGEEEELGSGDEVYMIVQLERTNSVLVNRSRRNMARSNELKADGMYSFDTRPPSPALGECSSELAPFSHGSILTRQQLR
jgi:hypothetical protein